MRCTVGRLPTMFRNDRKRVGWSVEQVAQLLEVTIREYRELEAGAWAFSDDRWRSV
jgi:transcriptional regulator with XRE-family HTH domain